MKTILLAFVLALAAISAQAQDRQQTRFYDARGNSIGTAAPQGDGSTRFYDARGNSVGTSTTLNGTTTFYGPRGNVTGTATTPGAPFPGFGGGRR